MKSENYIKKVYGGVLGKIIGVYMGRPFENWTHEQILEKFGEVDRYVNMEVGAPLVLTDDDISGAFTFIRSLEDYDFNRNLTAAEIGQTWLNYLVYKRTILWWGGLGNSTEHTAYLRLKKGLQAPASGAAATNGQVTANQIGAQIFIDGWALVSPGNTEQAAEFAKKAASVSHDGEAINAAVAIAVLEAEAFVERNIQKLLDKAMTYVPPDSVIARQTHEIRTFHQQNPDWRAAREWLDREYGYHLYPGVCHVVPNYGLVIMSLLYGDGDFLRSMTIVNTSGHDTDCNAASLGCILGIRGGLEAIQIYPHLRIPHRDLMYISSADGGRCVTDALREAYYLANVGLRLLGKDQLSPKGGARYHFSLPGSLHAFRSLEQAELAIAGIFNSQLPFSQDFALELRLKSLGKYRIATPVFSLESRELQYETQASPSLYPGQTVTARMVANQSNSEGISVRFFVQYLGGDDKEAWAFGPSVVVDPGAASVFSWLVDMTIDGPIVQVGVELSTTLNRGAIIWLDFMDWSGIPNCKFRRYQRWNVQWWKNAWVNAVDEWGVQFPESFHLSQNEGTGLIIQGTRDWTDYEVVATVTPFQAEEAGVAARVQGLRRYYALLLCRDGLVRLIKERDGRTILGAWNKGITEYTAYHCKLVMRQSTIEAFLDGKLLFTFTDSVQPLLSGAIGLVLTEGTLSCDEVQVSPVGSIEN